MSKKAKGKPWHSKESANKRVFHLVYNRSVHGGGSGQHGPGRL